MQSGHVEKLKIDVPFRIHLNLHALHKCKLRKNGGLGFGVRSKCILSARKSAITKIHIDGICTDKSKIRIIEEKLNSIKELYKLKHCMNVEIRGDLFFHCGLGIGTAITLAAIESLFLINKQSISISEIQKLSSRGGTSGIGIHSYFEGGMIFDGGVRQDDKEHLPSSSQSPEQIPLKLLRIPLPDWRCIFVIPIVSDFTSGEKEEKFFQMNTPIAKEHSYEATYVSVMGVIPSILEKNYEMFRSSISSIQQTKWKSLEISNTSEESLFLIRLGNELGIACGMSSVGSGVYFIGDQSLKVLSDKLAAKDYHLVELELTNIGRCINFV
jgi:beta-ribofuranosylaminobenzene 5'-phosphate synthase